MCMRTPRHQSQLSMEASLICTQILLPAQFMICVSDHELLMPFRTLTFINLRKYGKLFSKYFHLSEVLFDGGVYLCTSPHTTFFTNSRRSLGSAGPMGVPNVSCIIAIKASM